MSTNSVIYLDYAAATPLDPRVLEVMRPFFSEQFYNPSATYAAARDVHRSLADARARIAHWLGSKPSEVIFTAGGTEANNLAIHGVMRQFPDANVLVSAVEHESVLAPAARYNCRQVGVDAKGRLLLDDLRQKIDGQTVLVSVMYANNEVGTIQPIREISQLLEQFRQQRLREANPLPLYLHTDACQAGNYLDLHVARLAVDLLTLNGGKIYGPKQSGALYVKSSIQLEPMIDGGGQERGLRSGTENVAAAMGLAAAFDMAQQARHDETKRLQELQAGFMNQLTTRLPSSVINGPQKLRLPNNAHVTFPGIDNERLLIQLDEAGILAAAGSACSASNQTPSHVLQAMGLSVTDAQSSIRITFGRSTTTEMLNQTVAKLKQFTITRTA